MEVQSVINESALKEARKYLIKPGIRKISAIASAAFVLLAAYCMLTGRPSTRLIRQHFRRLWQYLQLSFFMGN